MKGTKVRCPPLDFATVAETNLDPLFLLPTSTSDQPVRIFLLTEAERDGETTPAKVPLGEVLLHNDAIFLLIIHLINVMHSCSQIVRDIDSTQRNISNRRPQRQ